MTVITKTVNSEATTNSEAQGNRKLSTKMPAMEGPMNAPSAEVDVLNNYTKSEIIKNGIEEGIDIPQS